MRKMLIVLLLLVPVAVWGADKKVSQAHTLQAEKKAEQDQ